MSLAMPFWSLAMPFWFGKQRVSKRRAEEKADQLIFDFGDEAYGEARRHEREAYGLEAAAYWRHVALAVARKTGKSLAVHTATPTLEGRVRSFERRLPFASSGLPRV
jgi:hypothetical protein